MTGGLFSSLGGGSFGSGFLSGAISSGASSLIGNRPWGQIAFGGLSGGIGSAIGGGSFWDGLGQGLITSGLNHVAHSLSVSSDTENCCYFGDWRDDVYDVMFDESGKPVLFYKGSGERYIPPENAFEALGRYFSVGIGGLSGKLPWEGLKRVPKGEYWVNLATGKGQKGGTFVSKLKNYLKFGDAKKTKSFMPNRKTFKIQEAPHNVWRDRLKAISDFLGIGT